MKTLTATALLSCVVFAFPVLADTFVMKDGSKLEGAVLRETPDSYVVEVQVTKSIKDERSLAKADVASVVREKPDAPAFERIAGFVPVPDALTSDEYALRIRAVEKFLTDHRGSDRSKEAKEMLATLKAEANEILAGGVKLNGKIITPSEYRANAYDIDARIEAAKIKRLADAARYPEALRAFAAFDRDFSKTSSHRELLPLIKRVIPSYLAGIAESSASFDARIKERNTGLERMAPADRRGSQTAIAEQDAEFESRFKAEKDANIGWVTTHPFFKPSLDQTISFGKQELARLDAAAAAPEADAGKTYRDALTLIQSGGNQAGISAAISAARNAMVAQRYIENLEAAAKAGGFKP